MRYAIGLIFLVFTFGGAALAQDLRLAAPAEMVDSGFLKHILPRFKIKHRIVVVPVALDEPADMALVADGTDGLRVFSAEGVAEYRLTITTPGDGTAKFSEWLTSTPGRSAIEGFPRGGPPKYTTDLPVEVVREAPEITGDVALGSRLALVHCGRCHVVDQRNRMGGIGSTPSFAAMRAREHWFDLFSKYWSENPHPSFTEVVGVTEPFGEGRVTHIAPVQITLQEIDAIIAFVETIEPKNLGRPIRSN